MKRYFYAGLIIIFLMAFALVGYGAWLNYSDENQIAKRMDSRVVQLTGAKATIRDFQPTIDMDAVRFSSDSMTDAIALVDGRILNWYVGKNDSVRKGDPLISLANESIPLKLQQATSAVRKAEAVLAQAVSSYQRQGRLMAKNATSKEKYEESQAQYLAAQEALREAEAQREQLLVQEGWLTVVSPVDGEVIILYQREGAYIQAGTPIALVGNFDRLTFSINLDDSNARNLKIGDVSTLSFLDRWAMGKAYDTGYGAGNSGWDQKIYATLKEITPPLSEPADVRRAVWEVDNRTRLLEPMTYRGVEMRTGSSYKCLTVPLGAMFDKARDKVYVVEDGTIHIRNVKAGTDDDKYVEILEGLSEGDVVVVGNFEGLSDGMRVEITLDEGER
ncbi:MAG TPA: hypothetical protein DEP57_05870 [Selenomonas sp.]|nr:hypothetical protein [Selenomonas sp.]